MCEAGLPNGFIPNVMYFAAKWAKNVKFLTVQYVKVGVNYYAGHKN